MKKEILLIGDTHGKVEHYKNIILDSDVPSIQLGDFGFKNEHDWFIEQQFNKHHKILFGNHDYYPYVYNEHSLGDFGYIEEYNLFYIRGAWSIDWMYRIKGRDLFDEEELNTSQGLECIKLYEEVKPDFVISHDCPLMIYPSIITNFGKIEGSSTPKLLNELFNIHEPKEWYFGHHHNSKTIQIKNTKFQCLNELETYNFEIRI